MSNAVAATLISAFDSNEVSSKAVETDRATSVTRLTSLKRSSDAVLDVYKF